MTELRLAVAALEEQLAEKDRSGRAARDRCEKLDGSVRDLEQQSSRRAELVDDEGAAQKLTYLKVRRRGGGEQRATRA